MGSNTVRSYPHLNGRQRSMSMKTLLELSSQRWLLEDVSKLPPTIVNVPSGAPNANERPLLVLVPGFLADAPSMLKERLQPKMDDHQVYKSSEWEAVAQDLISKLGCEVSIFSWPNGSDNLFSDNLFSEKLVNTMLVGHTFEQVAARATIASVGPGAIAVAIVAPAVGFIVANSVAKWKLALKNSDRAHLLLSPYVRKELEHRPSVLVVGHSLGGRIALKTAYDLEVARRFETLNKGPQVIALAPAIGPKAMPAGAHRMTRPIADVGWSAKDEVLKWAFWGAARSEGAALGCTPADWLKPAIDFHDVSSIAPGCVTGHSSYTRDLLSYVELLPQGRAFMQTISSSRHETAAGGE